MLREAVRGDELAATKRLAELAGIDVLTLDDGARQLAHLFVGRRLIPEKAVEDAFHIAVATSQGMDFLLTWNCRHIANAEVMNNSMLSAWKWATECRPFALLNS